MSPDATLEPGRTLSVTLPSIIDTVAQWATGARTPAYWFAPKHGGSTWSQGVGLHETAPDGVSGTPAAPAYDPRTIAARSTAYEATSGQDSPEWVYLRFPDPDHPGVLAVFVGDLAGRRLAAAAAILSETEAHNHRPPATIHDQLVADVRHEVRGPLTVIQGVSSQLLAEPDMDLADRTYFLSALTRESIRVSTIMEELLVWWRLTPGVDAVRNTQPIDLRQTLQALIEPLQAHAITRHIGLTTSLAATPPVIGDPGLCSVLLRAIVTSALASLGPQGTVEVDLRPTDDGVQVSVTDNGPPPPEPALSSFRRSTSAGKHTPGVGIGLALAHRIAEVHGWRLTYTNTPDGRSVVTLFT